MSLIIEETRVAIETERKYEFYIVGAILTILGLAVSTVEVYPGEVWRNRTIILAFAFLTAAAICAIFSLRRLMQRHWVIANMQGWLANVQTLRFVQAPPHNLAHVDYEGPPRRRVPIAEAIAEADENRQREAATSLHQRHQLDWLRGVRDWAFLVGLLLLLLTKLWPVLCHGA